MSSRERMRGRRCEPLGQPSDRTPSTLDDHDRARLQSHLPLPAVTTQTRAAATPRQPSQPTRQRGNHSSGFKKAYTHDVSSSYARLSRNLLTVSRRLLLPGGLSVSLQSSVSFYLRKNSRTKMRRLQSVRGTIQIRPPRHAVDHTKDFARAEQRGLPFFSLRSSGRRRRT